MGEGKTRRARTKLFTYLRVLVGTKCDRLSINCSFEGKLLFLRWKWIEETSCHALLCLEKELSLEMLRRETMCSLCSASEERRRPPPLGLVLCEDRCSLTGFFSDVPTCAPLSYAVCLLRRPAAASSAAVRDGGACAATLSTTLRRDTVAKEAGGAVLEWKSGANGSNSRSITTSCICRCPHSIWEVVADITVKSP